ncbi:MAG: type-F conjugative transfer system secretin TraK [Rhizobacter sp.]
MNPLKGLAIAGLMANAGGAWALQTVEGRDGVSVDAAISIKEPTRIKVEGASITDVFGNIYSSNCGGPAPVATPKGGGANGVNYGGEVVLECDRDKGEIYVKPVGNGTKPVNLFISTANATYTLILRRVDMPADTIIVRDRAVAAATAATAANSRMGGAGNHVKSIKTLLAVMASDKPAADVRVQDVRRPVELWQEAQFMLLRTYASRGMVGEKYMLTNSSKEPMVLAEQEFDRDSNDVLAVSIENLNLRPGESTVVYIIRTEG